MLASSLEASFQTEALAMGKEAEKAGGLFVTTAGAVKSPDQTAMRDLPLVPYLRLALSTGTGCVTLIDSMPKT